MGWLGMVRKVQDVAPDGAGNVDLTGLFAPVGGALDWVNVQNHGATGDGTTDDTTAIQAAIDATPEGGTCYFPVPDVDYKVTAPLVLPHKMRLAGAGGFIGQHTNIRQATANTNLIVCPTATSAHCVIDGLALMGTLGGQTAGAAIVATQSVVVTRSRTSGFYDGLRITVTTNDDAAVYCVLNQSFFDSATRAGIRLVGNVNNLTWHDCRANSNAVGVQVVGGPLGLRLYGGAIEDNNVGLDIDGLGDAQSTSGVLVSGTYFEQADTKTDVRLGNGSAVHAVSIHGAAFIKSNLAGTGWHIDGVNVEGLEIHGCVFTSTEAVRVVSPSTNVTYGKNYNVNTGTVTLPAGTIRLDAAAVTPSNLDGTAATAGTSHYLARADHEHGAVVVPGGISATGTPSSSTYLRGDGAWATPAGGGGALRVEDEGTSIVAAATGINFVGAGVTVTDAGSDEATVTISGGGGSAELLAVIRYAPSQTVLSTTSTSLVDVDATNLAITFTAPSSGKVLVRLSGYGDVNGAAGEGWWGLREGTTNLQTCRMMRVANAENYLTANFYLTGLSAGSHTYKWSYGVGAAGQTTRIIVGPGSAITDFPGGLMEVWAAP